MKKLSAIVIFMGILIALVSCKKSEDFSPAQKEQVKIFFKSVSSSQLKSGSVDIQVKLGDTINSPINVNAIVYAEDANGKAIKVNWAIYSIKNDNPINLFTELQPDNWNVDQTSLMFPEYGIYKVSVAKENVQFDFFVKVFGIPGKIGDESENNSIFRLEKKNLTVLGGSGAKHRLLFIYYKFANTNWLNRKPQAYLSIYRNLQRTSTTRELLKWPFPKDKSDNYYYFVLDLEKSTDLGDYYEAGFEIAESNGGFGDDNVYRSSWSSGTGPIEFSIP